MMKPSTIAYVLIIVGILMMIYTGLDFVTTEKVVDVGPLQINKDNKHYIFWSPIVGGLILMFGISIFIITNRKNN